MRKFLTAVMSILVMVALSAAGCAKATPEATSIPAGMGRIEVRVTDMPPELGVIDRIVVTVEEEDGVMVHKAGAEGEDGWVPISVIEEHNPFELYPALVPPDVDELLAWNDVDPGKYTQIKMIITKVEIYANGEEEPIEADIKLPSGKLKLICPFDVVDGDTTIIKLDFLVDRCLTVTGQGKVIFKPVIKLIVSGKEKPIELEYSMETMDSSTAELSDANPYGGEESVHLLTNEIAEPGNEARIVIPLPEGTTLGEIESISWWEYNVTGYPPHLDMFLDVNKNTTWDEYLGGDDILVFEYAYNTTIHYDGGGEAYGAETDGWYQTFDDDDDGPAQIAGTEASAWPGSGPAGPPESIELNTLAEWQSETGITYDTKTVDSTTPVLRLEIEVDNWVAQSEAYVDDIEIVINGIIYTIDI